MSEQKRTRIEKARATKVTCRAQLQDHDDNDSYTNIHIDIDYKLYVELCGLFIKKLKDKLKHEIKNLVILQFNDKTNKEIDALFNGDKEIIDLSIIFIYLDDDI